MTFIEEIKATDVLKKIRDVYRDHEVLPCTGFLAGTMKCTIHTIYRKMDELERLGYIKRIKKDKNFTKYELLIK